MDANDASLIDRSNKPDHSASQELPGSVLWLKQTGSATEELHSPLDQWLSLVLGHTLLQTIFKHWGTTHGHSDILENEAEPLREERKETVKGEKKKKKEKETMPYRNQNKISSQIGSGKSDRNWLFYLHVIKLQDGFMLSDSVCVSAPSLTSNKQPGVNKNRPQHCYMDIQSSSCAKALWWFLQNGFAQPAKKVSVSILTKKSKKKKKKKSTSGKSQCYPVL